MREKVIIKVDNISYTENDFMKYINTLFPGDRVCIVQKDNTKLFCNCIYFPRKSIEYNILQTQYYHLNFQDHLFLYHGETLYSPRKNQYHKNGYYHYGYKLKGRHINEQKKKIEISLFL